MHDPLKRAQYTIPTPILDFPNNIIQYQPFIFLIPSYLSHTIHSIPLTIL